MKLSFSQKHRPDPELLALKEELLEAQGELTLAYRRFDQAVDPELVESCVYQISAVKARCNYLIRSIKERDPEALAAANAAPVKARRRGFSGKMGTREMGAFLPTGKHEPHGAREDDGEVVWT